MRHEAEPPKYYDYLRPELASASDVGAKRGNIFGGGERSAGSRVRGALRWRSREGDRADALRDSVNVAKKTDLQAAAAVVYGGRSAARYAPGCATRGVGVRT